MRHENRRAELYLNGIAVGQVRLEGASGAWGFGHFEPRESFARFSTLFGAWSLLIHEDDDLDHSTDEVLEELREAESAIDALRAELLWSDTQERTALRQLTIDGSLIEWNQGMKV
jgi:hypothetical protein